MLKMSSAEFEKVLHPIFQEDEATLIGKHCPYPLFTPYYLVPLCTTSIDCHHFMAYLLTFTTLSGHDLPFTILLLIQCIVFGQLWVLC